MDTITGDSQTVVPQTGVLVADGVVSAPEKDQPEDQWMQGLMAMTGLRVLRIGRLPDCVHQEVRKFILQNRETLELLVLDPSIEFPVSRFTRSTRNSLTSFPVLKNLVCGLFYTAIAESCPRLESLTCSKVTSPLAVESLPGSYLTHLTMRADPEFEQEEVHQVVVHICQFRRLEGLNLTLGSGTESLNRLLFQIICRLRVLVLCVRTDLVMDQAVHKLALRNPLLHQIVLQSMGLTDASLVSLRRLKELTELRIQSSRANFSPDGLLAFVRDTRSEGLTACLIECPIQVENQKSLLERLKHQMQESGRPLNLLVRPADPDMH